MSKADIMKTMDPFIAFAAADELTFHKEPATRSKPSPSPATSTTAQATGELHASHPPDEGCVWVPYRSKKWNVELLRQHCTSGHNDWQLSDTADGIGMALSGYPANTAIQILSKLPDQPVETAVQQQVIAKFKDPAARAGCRAVRQAQEEELGWYEYAVQAFGAYGKRQPKTPEETEKDGMEFCGGLYNADVSSVFIYNPEVSRTHFFALYGLSDLFVASQDVRIN